MKLHLIHRSTNEQISSFMDSYSDKFVGVLLESLLFARTDSVSFSKGEFFSNIISNEISHAISSDLIKIRKPAFLKSFDKASPTSIQHLTSEVRKWEESLVLKIGSIPLEMGGPHRDELIKSVQIGIPTVASYLLIRGLDRLLSDWDLELLNQTFYNKSELYSEIDARKSTSKSEIPPKKPPKVSVLPLPKIEIPPVLETPKEPKRTKSYRKLTDGLKKYNQQHKTFIDVESLEIASTLLEFSSNYDPKRFIAKITDQNVNLFEELEKLLTKNEASPKEVFDCLRSFGLLDYHTNSSLPIVTLKKTVQNEIGKAFLEYYYSKNL